MEKLEILELAQVDYSHLIDPSLENKCIQNVMEALGPGGPGLMAVTGVPGVEALRITLLPLSRKLALMDDTQRRCILKDHGLGTDVPLKKSDRNVSSFAAQLKFARNVCSKLERENESPKGDIDHKQRPASPPEGNSEPKVIDREYAEVVFSQGHHGGDFEKLGNSFRQLGFCMVEVGLLLARLCDRAIGGIDVENTILESSTAKGRLIHYHSLSERILLMNSVNTKRTKKGLSAKDVGFQLGCAHSRNCLPVSSDQNIEGKGHHAVPEKNASFHKQTDILPSPPACDLWQQWHYDYGIFTLLTAPLFLSTFELSARNIENGCTITNQDARECSSPDGHTYLKILNTVNGKEMFASAPSGGLIIQVGEAAQILSGGKLRATVHCVCRPSERADVSRETFVVFLQPSWNKPLSSGMWLNGEKTETKHDGKDISTSSSIDMTQTNELKNKFISLSPFNEDEPSSKYVKQKSTENIETFIGDLNCSDVVVVNEIQKIVPPLMSRWKEGQTFAEFSRETTRQYYGADGMQSRR